MFGLLSRRMAFTANSSSVRAFSQASVRRQTAPSFNSINIADNLRDIRNVNIPQSSSASSSSSSNSGISSKIHYYTLYCNFTKNNTHLTLTAATEDLSYKKKNPNITFTEEVLYYYQLPQKVKISLSTGQLGFRKSARGEYEASFQTSAKMFALMKERGYLDQNIQIVIKNFGKGREAFFDALKGKEGSDIKGKITRLSDNTKLKFGGTRSPSIRRL